MCDDCQRLGCDKDSTSHGNPSSNNGRRNRLSQNSGSNTGQVLLFSTSLNLFNPFFNQVSPTEISDLFFVDPTKKAA